MLTAMRLLPVGLGLPASLPARSPGRESVRCLCFSLQSCSVARCAEGTSSDRHLVFTSLRSTWCRCPCRGACTLVPVWKAVCWSLGCSAVAFLDCPPRARLHSRTVAASPALSGPCCLLGMPCCLVDGAAAAQQSRGPCPSGSQPGCVVLVPTIPTHRGTPNHPRWACSRARTTVDSPWTRCGRRTQASRWPPTVHSAPCAGIGRSWSRSWASSRGVRKHLAPCVPPANTTCTMWRLETWYAHRLRGARGTTAT